MGPYFLAHGKAFCGRCGRLPLTHDRELNLMFCRHCDEGELPRLAHYPVDLIDGELICMRCKVNTMTPTAGLGALECPACDLPPWERHKLDDKVFHQLTIDGIGDVPTFDDITESPDRPKRPAPVVRVCGECHQRTEHYWAWKLGRWRAMCPGCGHMIAGVRERPGYRKPTKGVRR